MLPHVDIYRRDNADYLLMNSPDLVSASIKNQGFWAGLETNLCLSILHGVENKVVIDAGANLGAFTVPVAKALQPLNGSVVCFEPQRIVFQQLCANVFFNRLDNVYTFNMAVGDVDKSIEIPELDFSKSKNVGGLTLDTDIKGKIDNLTKGTHLENVSSQTKKSYTVQQVKLDGLGYFENVGFIKVDVEGYELAFFEGARKTIIENNYPPIIFELWGMDWYKEKAERTKQYLVNLGYSFTQFGDEVLAQHPAHERFLEVIQEGTTMRVNRVKKS